MENRGYGKEIVVKESTNFSLYQETIVLIILYADSVNCLWSYSFYSHFSFNYVQSFVITCSFFFFSSDLCFIIFSLVSHVNAFTQDLSKLKGMIPIPSLYLCFTAPIEHVSKVSWHIIKKCWHASNYCLLFYYCSHLKFCSFFIFTFLLKILLQETTNLLHCEHL